jgi:diaminohydroxyphosphoribosylaminopyrimidine deaminase / 5-amino-6-(5-phosphoribosylamino)uracil reductase
MNSKELLNSKSITYTFCPHSKLLKRHGIKRVVAGMVDPDPRVSGYGLQYLRDNGVVVDIAQMEEAAACRSLNAPFVFRMQTDRAYGIVLAAADEKGYICNPLGRYGSTSPDEPTVAEMELSALLNQLAPETNAIVLTSSQFLTVPYSVLQALPLHITLAITVSSFNEEMAADILQVMQTAFLTEALAIICIT